MARDVVVPQHREVRFDHLVDSRQVHPDLEQLDGVRFVTRHEREHLGVHDAASRGHPLHVTSSVPGGGSERVGVVDQTAADEGDRLEPAMRVLRKARHLGAVVHPPSVDAFEVLTQRAAS